MSGSEICFFWRLHWPSSGHSERKLASVGQRTAIQAIAWALIKIFQRVDALGMVTNIQMELPYTQCDMADALAMLQVHTNKTLGKSNDRQHASWIERVLQINDREALAKIAAMSIDKVQQKPFFLTPTTLSRSIVKRNLNNIVRDICTAFL